MPVSGSKVGPVGVNLIHPRAQRDLVKWLAFVAMALIIVAPSVSRLRQALSPATMAMDMAAMGSDCPSRASEGRAPHMPEHPGMPMEGDACGYCTLMCHNPALASAITLIVLPLPRAPFSVFFGSTRAPALALLERRSRGPPIV